MFAIIDVETTGGNPKKDRITEIAIFVHNGKRVIEQYCTLVNPEREISPFITALTGISNEMVAEAPKWEEVAEKVAELTQGRVFVAHNVRFDYSFISNEFRRIGERYIRKQLCTVRLTRAILPGLPSYSLGRICEHVGIPVEHRHRAFGDGAATAELFNILMQNDRQSLIADTLKDEITQSIMPPNLRREQLEELPEETGIYYFRDERGKILYIGKSNNIRQRVISHFSSDMNSEKHIPLKRQIFSIDYELTGNELVALILESQEIKRWMPPYNAAQRRKKFRFGIYKDYDANGYANLRLSLIRLEGEPVLTTSNRRTGENILMSMVEKHGLCLRKCGLDVLSEEGGCINHHAGECDGACIGAEDADVYNSKLESALMKYQFNNPDFIIVGEGRRPQERALICVENGRYRGFGFLDEPEEGSMGFDELKSCVTTYPDHPDLQKIIRSFLNKGKKGTRIIVKN